MTRAEAQEKAINHEDIEKGMDSNKSMRTKSTRKAMREKFRAQYHRKLKVVTAD